MRHHGPRADNGILANRDAFTHKRAIAHPDIIAQRDGSGFSVNIGAVVYAMPVAIGYRGAVAEHAARADRDALARHEAAARRDKASVSKGEAG